ncbi:MAG: hypothetical protein N3F64_07350 [Nitrososphaeria archaeon]|nr:hypothetical protein [Nitrososphaeria archaeon]
MIKSSFTRLENRILLKNRLYEKGFSVRFHSYEYYVIRNKFVSIILLEPNFNRVLIYKISWNPIESEIAVKEIYSIIKKIDPFVKIIVEENKEY